MFICSERDIVELSGMLVCLFICLFYLFVLFVCFICLFVCFLFVCLFVLFLDNVNLQRERYC